MDKTMQEYLLLIRTEGDYCDSMAPDKYKEHIAEVSGYINKLTREGKLKVAQPLQYSGAMLQSSSGIIKDGPFIESKEVIAGYFLILAEDINEAKEIARANPIFRETDARIEIRPIKHEAGIN
jgi:hypothetical protein